MATAKRKVAALLPQPDELAALDSGKIELLLTAVKQEGDRDLHYAALSMKCGTGCLIASLILFTFLVMQGHDNAAAVIFGTSVLGLLGKIVLARLE
jgi:hypothetical protein